MKPLTILFAVLISFLLTFCGRQDADELTPVRKPDAQTQSFLNGIDYWVAKQDFSKMTPQQFSYYIYSVNPNIDWDVRNELLRFKKIQPGEGVSLKYHYFNEESKAQMEDSSGKYSPIKFKNKFVVEVIRPGNKKLWIALSCLNGMLEIEGTPVISTDARMEFTITKGKGLAYYLRDDYWSINLAETFSLPLYKGKIQKSKYKITPAQARRLVPSVDTMQITVFTKEGWHFVLRGDRWTLNGLTPIQFRNR